MQAGKAIILYRVLRALLSERAIQVDEWAFWTWLQNIFSVHSKVSQYLVRKSNMHWMQVILVKAFIGKREKGVCLALWFPNGIRRLPPMQRQRAIMNLIMTSFRCCNNNFLSPWQVATSSSSSQSAIGISPSKGCIVWHESAVIIIHSSGTHSQSECNCQIYIRLLLSSSICASSYDTSNDDEDDNNNLFIKPI